MTPAGIEPATFRFVAQYLNYGATAVHTEFAVRMEIITLTEVCSHLHSKM